MRLDTFTKPDQDNLGGELRQWSHSIYWSMVGKEELERRGGL